MENERHGDKESEAFLEHALRMLNNATMRVGTFGNQDIKVVRRDEAEAILRDALRPAVITALLSARSAGTSLSDRCSKCGDEVGMRLICTKPGCPLHSQVAQSATERTDWHYEALHCRNALSSYGAALTRIKDRRCTNPKPVGDSACECCTHHWYAISDEERKYDEREKATSRTTDSRGHRG